MLVETIYYMITKRGQITMLAIFKQADKIRLNLCCASRSAVFWLFCFQGDVWRNKNVAATLDDTLTLPVFAMMCSLMCALNWLTRLYRLPCGRHRSILPGLRFLGCRGGEVYLGRKKDRNKERMGEGGNIDQMACTLSSMFTWPSKLLASSLQHAADVHSSFAFFLPSSLQLSFCLSPVWICVWACACVCVYVSVCMHARAADKA